MRPRRRSRPRYLSLASPAVAHFHPSLSAWIARAQSTAFRPEPDYYSSRADWAREWLRSFPHFLRAETAIFERASNVADLRFGWARRIRYARTVHPQFIARPEFRAAMFGPVDPGPRRFRVAYLGNRQPAPRAERLDAMLRALHADSRVKMHHRYPSASTGDLEALWIEYGAEGSRTRPRTGDLRRRRSPKPISA